MNTKEKRNEFFTILLASLILATTFAFKNTSIFYAATASFFAIITINVLTKKIVGYNLEVDVKTKFWEMYQFGFKKTSHFKRPVPMAWLPIVITLLTRGFFKWLGILEFDVRAKTERVSKRHGLYRFTEVTEWHVAWIAVLALIANLIFAIVGYIAGYDLFARLSIYFIAWSTIPLGKLDGSKIFYGSRALWSVVFTIAIIMLGWSLIII